MPKVSFQATRLTASDVRLAQAFVAAQSGYQDDVQRQLTYLEEFMKQNSWLKIERYSRNDIWTYLAAQWCNSGRTMASALTMVTNFVTFRVCPWNIEQSRARVREQGVLNGLRRYARIVHVQERRFLRVVHVLPLPYVERSPPAAQRDAEYQAIWCLVCVTGNRPHDVMLARILSVNMTQVTIMWPTRKVKFGVTETYDFSWTSVPPVWVLRRWRRQKDEPWQFRSADNMAACLNTWLRRKGSRLTSSSPRERLDRHLRQLVEKGLMSQTRYELLLDHKYATAVGHYNSATVVNS